jgi:hypothetical protein
LYDIHQKKVAECDKRIETVLEQLKATRSTPAKPLPAQAARVREGVAAIPHRLRQSCDQAHAAWATR